MGCQICAGNPPRGGGEGEVLGRRRERKKGVAPQGIFPPTNLLATSEKQAGWKNPEVKKEGGTALCMTNFPPFLAGKKNRRISISSGKERTGKGVPNRA